MTSLLFSAPASYLKPAEAVALKSAEYDAHNAAMGIVDEIREALPANAKRAAEAAAIIGYTSALGRIFAIAPDQHRASLSVMNLSKVVAAEQRYWLHRATVLH